MADRLNELNGKDWLKYSFSIWRDLKKNKEEKELNHPAIFPLALTRRITRIFTKKGDVVLDPFMGLGSTVIGAALEGRKAIGLELSKDFCKGTKDRIKTYKADLFLEDYITPDIYNKDAREIDDIIKPESVNLCLTSPPYWDILNRKRTADRKKSMNYGNSEKDLGNLSEYNYFLKELMSIFKKIFKILKDDGYCVVVVMDIRKKSNFYSLHSDISGKMEEIGYSFEDIIIWDRQHEYNNMRPLGYPYKFRVNKVHEYILIFSKRENEQ